MKVIMFSISPLITFFVTTAVLQPLILIPPMNVEALSFFQSTVVEDQDECYNKNCHSHSTGPCLDPLYLFPFYGKGDIPTNGIFSGPVQVGGSLLNSFVESQAYDMAYTGNNPGPTAPPPSFVFSVHSYAKVTGSCSGYTKNVPKQAFYPACEDSGTLAVPWEFNCRYTIETAKGNLMLMGSIPSAYQCFLNLLQIGDVTGVGGNELVLDYYKGYVTNTDSLLGKCCSDFAITGGTDSYCSSEGSVRVCQLMEIEFGAPGFLDKLLPKLCSDSEFYKRIEYGVSFNFDKLKGCEKDLCCDAPKAICG